MRWHVSGSTSRRHRSVPLCRCCSAGSPPSWRPRRGPARHSPHGRGDPAAPGRAL
jgi:hypothetical protein